MFKSDFFHVADEPEIHVDKAWIHADVGVEVEISCIVHAEPMAEVSNDHAVTNVAQTFFFSISPMYLLQAILHYV